MMKKEKLLYFGIRNRSQGFSGINIQSMQGWNMKIQFFGVKSHID